ncbi:MAG: hypothetical protein QOK40_3159 [Miltoncostaeaceae bacterium]|jgi:hypothetical protein|nr:hypothetical protein [Miltoncostaeaceae bacterium]
MGRLGLRARLIAAFVAVAAIATPVAALRTTHGLDASFERYQIRRSADTAQSAALARESYAASRRAKRGPSPSGASIWPGAELAVAAASQLGRRDSGADAYS